MELYTIQSEDYVDTFPTMEDCVKQLAIYWTTDLRLYFIRHGKSDEVDYIIVHGKAINEMLIVGVDRVIKYKFLYHQDGSIQYERTEMTIREPGFVGYSSPFLIGGN